MQLILSFHQSMKMPNKYRQQEKSPCGRFSSAVGVKCSMNNIKETLMTISKERTVGFSGAFIMVSDIVKKYGEKDIANNLWAVIPENSDLDDVSDLYGILIWSTEDNGFELVQTAEKWLTESTDYRKVYVSLHLDVYPFNTRSEMVSVFSKVVATFPNLKHVCEKLIVARSNGT